MGLDTRLAKRAEKDLDSLPTEARERLIGKFEEAAEWPDHYLKRLSGYDLYSLQAGKYWAVVDWDKKSEVLTMVLADHRDKVYQRLP
jgi:mRNA interferase RelE/StbE